MQTTKLKLKMKIATKKLKSNPYLRGIYYKNNESSSK
jgi:hypothetical protein